MRSARTSWLGPVTDKAAATSPERAEDRRGDAADADVALLTVDRPAALGHRGQLPHDRDPAGQRARRAGGQRPGQRGVDDRGLRVREDRPAQRRAVRRDHPADLRQHRHGPVPGDLFHHQDLRAVQHAELHGDPRGLVQVLQERQRRLAQFQPDRRQARDLEQAVPDAVPVAGLFQPAEPDHAVRGPVRGRAGQPAPGDQDGQRELAVVRVERAEDRRRAVQPALRRRPSR